MSASELLLPLVFVLSDRGVDGADADWDSDSARAMNQSRPARCCRLGGGAGQADDESVVAG
jgi:hypothetical protein